MFKGIQLCGFPIKKDNFIDLINFKPLYKVFGNTICTRNVKLSFEFVALLKSTKIVSL